MLKLSASRIKTHSNCSWLYYVNYVLNLPRSTNDGASRGSAVHVLLECLLKPKRRELVKRLQGDIKCSKSVNRLMLKLAKQYNVLSEENLDLLYKFLHTGIKTDFYGESGNKDAIIQPAEFAFEIGDPKKDGYHAVGFIDKHVLFPKQKFVKIIDYKSSKSKFPAAELKDNVQGLMYSLAMHKKYPEFESEVDFIFLKFSRAPVQNISFKKDQILGFEEYLKYLYEHLNDYTLEKAKSNFAYDNGTQWLCGNVNYPGELKDDGSVKFYCPYRFPFDYYAVIDKNGRNIRTAYTLEELNLKPLEVFRKKSYGGCPKFF